MQIDLEEEAQGLLLEADVKEQSETVEIVRVLSVLPFRGPSHHYREFRLAVNYCRLKDLEQSDYVGAWLAYCQQLPCHLVFGKGRRKAIL